LDHIGTSPKQILEIGCGWGGFAEQAIQAGHQVTGLTLSTQQYAFAKQRLTTKSADIRLQDYRHTKGKFDAIASIEMFEAVGKRYWPAYFSTLKSSLSKGGVAMVQTITIQEQAFKLYEKSSDYLRHYVFPGGFLPSQLAFKTSAENAGLVCREFFQFGQHYAKTLKEWLQRFNAQETTMHSMGYSDAFIRSWRLYLSMCAASFTSGRTNVMQVELAHE
jgi:cyclopropane-fatty-acyl-phospholipid synthase